MPTPLNDENIRKLFGAEAAEDEIPERLKEYFIRNKSFESIKSDVPIKILVGHKGTGKSALLKMCYIEDQDEHRLAVWIRPDDLLFDEDEPTSFNGQIRSWKDRITGIIARKIVEAGATGIAEQVKRPNGTAQALMKFIETAMKAVSESSGDSKYHKVAAKFLKGGKLRVYIDDLDRGWTASSDEIRKISTLLNAARDLTNEDKNLQFRIALRTDIYFLVRTSDESTDKIEGSVTTLTWTNHEILVTLAKRVATYFGKNIDEATLVTQKQEVISREFQPILSLRFHGRGKWENIPIHRLLLSLTRKRPRDLVKLLSGAARQAHIESSQSISNFHLSETFESYSNERIQDLVNEFKTEMKEIDKLLYNMRPARRGKTTAEGFSFTNDQLIRKIRNIMSNHRLSITGQPSISPKMIA